MDMSPAMSAAMERVMRRRAAVENAWLPANVAELFDMAVERNGERPLWVSVDTGESHSYRAFDRMVARFAGALRSLGVGVSSHVALMAPNGPEFAAIWMAIARLGAVLVPINSRYTAREIEHVISLGDVDFLVVHAALASVLAEMDGTVRLSPSRMLAIGGAVSGTAGDIAALSAHCDPVVERVERRPDDLMTLQFTSGSTGAPKACMLPHSYWVVTAHIRAAQGPDLDRILIDMPFHYMGGQWRFLMTLLMDATAFVAPHPSLTRMFDWLTRYDIEFCSVTPALAKQEPDARRDRLRLKWAGTMGMSAKALQASMQRLNGAPVREMYGTTETGALVSMPVEVSWKTGSVGLAEPTRAIRIVDEKGEDVMQGKPGELLVRGPGMMLGYYKNPEATALAFTDGWFRTGDLFSQDEDGFLYMHGRIKDVIRRNGENISATEVEMVVQQIEGITEVAAIPIPDEIKGEELRLCVALAAHLRIDDVPPQAVMNHCTANLARFKLPRQIAYHDALPKTSSGKIEKPRLKDGTARSTRGTYDYALHRWL